ncbi:hypothetical protein DRQ18_03535 [bacterium]|nr:MAG: hypothetical protein DRQ18_03535 [bacterium]
METKFDTVWERIRELRKLREGLTEGISKMEHLLSRVSEVGVVGYEEVERLREGVQHFSATLQKVVEASEALVMTTAKGNESFTQASRSVEEFVRGMKTARKYLYNIKNFLGPLREESEKIGGILQEIEILNQISNSTARNAEIKAFHAGEMGKGFEVVAKELSNLTTASSRIAGELIQAIESLSGKGELAVEKFEKLEQTIAEFSDVMVGMESVIKDTGEYFERISSNAYTMREKVEREERVKRLFETLIDFLKRYSEKVMLEGDRLSCLTGEKKSFQEVLFFLQENIEDIYVTWKRGKIGEAMVYLSLLHLISFGKQFLNLLDSALFSLSEMMKGRRIEYGGEDVEEPERFLTEIDRLLQELKEDAAQVLERRNTMRGNLEKIEEKLGEMESGLEEIKSMLFSLEEGVTLIHGKVKEMGALAEQTRILSLYGKIEASRTGNEQELNVIVDQIRELSGKFDRIVEEIESFSVALRESIERISTDLSFLVDGIQTVKREGETIREHLEEGDGIVKYVIAITEEAAPAMEKEKKEVDRLIHAFQRFEKEKREMEAVLSEVYEIVRESKNEVDALVRGFEIIHKEVEGEGVIRMGLSGDPVHLDPAYMGDATSGRVGRLIFRGLFSFGKGINVYPFIVSHWHMGGEGKVWRLRIRDDIHFHNGKRLTSEDVKYSIDRVKNAPNSFFFDAVEEVKIVDNFTLEILLSYPYMPIFSNLATIAGSVVPCGMEHEELEKNPISIGPFRFAGWERGKRIWLEAFERYPYGRPYLKGFEYLIGKSEREEIELFKEGIFDIVELSLAMTKEAQTDPELRDCIISIPSIDIRYMGFNLSKDNPLSNKLVRQAISHAINREKIIEKVTGGTGKPAKGVFPPGTEVYNPSLVGYEYNLERARELLKKAGFEKGIPGEFVLWISDAETNKRMAAIIQEDLERIGVKVVIKENPWKEFLEGLGKGLPDMYLLGWSSDNGDPDNFLFPLFHSRNRGAAGNRSFYSNPEVDRLIEGGMREINPVKRREIYRRAEEIIVEDAPWVFLYHSVDFYLVSPKIHGFVPHPINFEKFEYVWRER